MLLGFPDYQVVGMGVAAAAALLCIGMVLCRLCRRHKGLRRRERAPRGTECAVLFAGVDGAGEWPMVSPTDAEAVVQQVLGIIAGLCDKASAYEVVPQRELGRARSGAGALVVHPDAQRALRLACEIQLALHRRRWAPRLGGLREHASVAELITQHGGDVVLQGPRVRIGVHYGPVVPQELPDGEWHYGGVAVAAASRMESVAAGGQVLCSEAVLDRASFMRGSPEYRVRDLGSCDLRGLEPLLLYSVLPKKLMRRDEHFPRRPRMMPADPLDELARRCRDAAVGGAPLHGPAAAAAATLPAESVSAGCCADGAVSGVPRRLVEELRLARAHAARLLRRLHELGDSGHIGDEDDAADAASPPPDLCPRVTVTVAGASGIVAADRTSSDPYCVVEMAGSTRRTAVIKTTLSPSWGESFEFKVPVEVSTEPCRLTVTVFDWDRLSADDCLGQAAYEVDIAAVAAEPAQLSLELLPREGFAEDAELAKRNPRGLGAVQIRLAATRGPPKFPAAMEMRGSATEVDGAYHRLGGVKVNGMPVWWRPARERRAGADGDAPAAGGLTTSAHLAAKGDDDGLAPACFFYSNSGGRWVANTALDAIVHTTRAELSAVKMHGGGPPTAHVAQWRRWEGRAFGPTDPGITAEDEAPFPERLRVLSPNGQRDRQGVYERMPDTASANGFPLWRRADGAQWLYSSPNGKWFVTERAEFVGNAGGLRSSVPHRGVAPHRVPAWRRWNGHDFCDDAEISVAPEEVESAAPTAAEAGSASDGASATAAARESSPALPATMVSPPRGTPAPLALGSPPPGRQPGGNPLRAGAKGGEREGAPQAWP